jgi:hypothetical protein
MCEVFSFKEKKKNIQRDSDLFYVIQNIKRKTSIFQIKTRLEEKLLKI